MSLSKATLESLGAWTPNMLQDVVSAGPPPFVIDGLIFRNTLNLAVGDSTLGKTPLMMSIAIAVAAGIPWMGRQTTQGPVLFLDGESTPGDMASMIGQLSKHAGLEAPPPDLVVYGVNYDQRHTPGEIKSTIKDLVRAIGPALVIVDPLRVFWPEAESKAEATSEMYNWQRLTGRPFGTAWITQHHRRKPNVIQPVNLTKAPREWLLESAGSRALINQSHTRLGIDLDGTDDRLVMHGLVRNIGELSHPIHFVRDFDSDGDPIGYSPLTGVNHLRVEWVKVYEELPAVFRYGDVKTALALAGTSGASSVMKFLGQCEAYQLLRSEGSGKQKRYYKLEAKSDGKDLKSQLEELGFIREAA